MFRSYQATHTSSIPLHTTRISSFHMSLLFSSYILFCSAATSVLRCCVFARFSCAYAFIVFTGFVSVLATLNIKAKYYECHNNDSRGVFAAITRNA
jgi:hypothetical protein